MSKKYPRTPHLPWSPGGTNDDKRLKTVDHFLSKRIVITEKMDGSNLCMTRDAVYARSHNGPPTHPSFDLAKALHASICRDIPRGISIFGEWVACLHSLEYNQLPGYFLVFGQRWDGKYSTNYKGPLCKKDSMWWSFPITEMRAKLLGLPTVPVLWRGVINTKKELEVLTSELANGPSSCGGEREGIVIRMEEKFTEKEFPFSIAKWVRADHPKDPDEHWMFKPIRKQGLVNV